MFTWHIVEFRIQFLPSYNFLVFEVWLYGYFLMEFFYQRLIFLHSVAGHSLTLLFHIFVVLLSFQYGKYLFLFSPLAYFGPLCLFLPIENWYWINFPHSNYIKRRGINVISYYIHFWRKSVVIYLHNFHV